jgi:hypothetical protein
MQSRTAHVVFTSCGALALSLAWLLVSRAHAEAPCANAPRACPVALHSDTARGLALSTGQRASAMSTSALAYNPAALILGKLYHIEGSVDYMSAWDSVALGAAVVDSSTSKIGAGVAFRGFISGKHGVGGIDGRAAIAFPLADLLSLGVGLRYMHLSADQEISSGVYRSVGLVDGFTMDASIRIQPSPVFQLAALATNFLDRGSAYAPVLLGGAAALSVAGIANIGADLLFDISSFDNSTGVNFGFSAEFFVAQIVPLRLGYGYDVQRELHILTGGAGYTDRSVGVDLSVQQELSRGSDTRVMGSFRYYVH